jgi:energy-coupling factor transporter transmembrane protein EcfT
MPLLTRGGKKNRDYRPALVEGSPLRRADPRVKLAMGLTASLAVMLPLEALLVFLAGYILFMGWARLLPMAARQTWRLRWFLAFLFVLDFFLVGWELAALVTLRLALLAGVFILLFATTTPRELSLALESLRLPYRYAFSFSLAFQSLFLLDDEWRAIYEAQRSRGLWPHGLWPHGILRLDRGWRALLRQLGDLIALTVPAVVLTTKRAWSITESAYARGFDAPHRRPYQPLKFTRRDWLLLAGVTGVALAVLWQARLPWV